MPSYFAHVRAIAAYNARNIRKSPLQELSGALGDMGTLLPLMIAMAVKGSIDLPSTLVFSGVSNIVVGAIFGIPLPVQPMKAVASVAISKGFGRQETAAAGLTVAAAIFVLSATGLLRWLHRVVPISVVKGIQVGAGLSLIVNAGASLILPLTWTSPPTDNRLWSVAAFLFLLAAAIVRRIPYALVVFFIGVLVAVVQTSIVTRDGLVFGWRPSIKTPSGKAWAIGAIDAALPQLPLTTLNSILAVTSLSETLFPDYPPTPSTTCIGLSIAIANLIGCWFGAMPICHGSGGLAGQFFFGARSGASVLVLGAAKLMIGLALGDTIVPVLQRFPKSLLGVMVLAAGIELAKVGQSLSADLWARAARTDCSDSADAGRLYLEDEGKERWMVMLVTVAGCLACKNDAVGFVAGMLWHWTLKLSHWYERRRRAGSIHLSNDAQDNCVNATQTA